MAYQTRTRDPLFDEATQRALTRRARELAGLGLIAAALVLAVALASYDAGDPSFLGTADGPPANWLGRFGAALAAPLMVILGLGAWALVAAAAGWGLRFVLHLGDARAVGRLVFAPIWVAIASVYAATVPPGGVWAHSFGLGGLFGDTVLGVLLGLLPLAPAMGLKLSAGALALGLVWLGLFVLGATRAELASSLRFLAFGLLFAYDRTVRGIGDAITARREARAERQALRQAEADGAWAEATWDEEEEDAGDEVFEDEPAPRRGLLGRLMQRRSDVPERAEPQLARAHGPDPDPDIDLEDAAPDVAPEERVQARITAAIRSKLRADRARAVAVEVRREPSLEAPMFRRAQAPTAAPDPAAAARGDDPFAPAGGDDPFARARGDDPFAPVRDEEPVASVRDENLAAEVAAPDWLQGGPGPEAEDADLALPADFPAPALPKAAPARPVVHQAEVRRPQPSARAMAEAQPSLAIDPAAEAEAYAPPPLALLRDPADQERLYLSDEALEENARMLETVLEDYGVKGDIVSVRPGPVVTMYELEPAPGLKASRVIGLADDIARSMSALSARVSTVPGRSVIGIELPNETREMVLLREILAARDFGDSKLKLPLALGKDIAGTAVVANLSKMPHLLIAGTTGSGKSVAINTMILSLLYKLGPDECRLIMIDPKMLELSVYDDIPHLLSPVVTDPKKAVVALKWVVAEMEERYRKMSKMGVRNIEGYNGKVKVALDRGELFSRTVQTGFDDDTGDPVFETEEFAPERLPYIVVIVDEMADLMMVAGKEIEACIQRLAQMARASGIHLIMATQRPSVDVITGTIKANFPTRISFQVTSKIDSRTILGEQGAEQLLGMGDMLYMAGGGRITRIHAPFVSDEEVEEVVRHLKALGPPAYVGGVADGPDEEKADDIDLVLGLGGNTTGEDALYDQAVAIVIQDRKCSTSYIQRKLAIGYNKAARLVEQMEEQGLVSAANHVGKREVLVPEQG